VNSTTKVNIPPIKKENRPIPTPVVKLSANIALNMMKPLLSI
jgi:hypothetical protein